MFCLPPPTVDEIPDAVLKTPPAIVELHTVIQLELPPAIVEQNPDAVLHRPPLTVE